jgi:hypothetical protein
LLGNELVCDSTERLGIALALLSWEAASVEMLTESRTHLPGDPRKSSSNLASVSVLEIQAKIALSHCIYWSYDELD